jgi:nucleotide-binding universal stress UspA family protein
VWHRSADGQPVPGAAFGIAKSPRPPAAVQAPSDLGCGRCGQPASFAVREPRSSVGRIPLDREIMLDLVTTDAGGGLSRILLAIDDSPESAAAASFVAVLASGAGADVLVLHVWDREAAAQHGESLEVADQLVAGVAARLSARGIAVTVRVRVNRCSEVATEIEAMAAQYRPDVLAMGSRGRGDLAGLALGSVSHKVLERVGCAVLVGRKHHSGSEAPLKRILLALAGNEDDSAAIEAASVVARSVNASVLVLHALRTLMDMSSSVYLQPLVAMAEVVTPAARALRERGLAAEDMVVPGSAPKVIVQTAQANQAGLIVLGPGRRSSDLGGLLLGDTANEVIRLSDLPVLIAAARPRTAAAAVNAEGIERRTGVGWGAGLEGKY